MQFWSIAIVGIMVFVTASALEARSPAQEQKDSYSSWQYVLDNHEIELQTLGERLNTQETLLDTLRQQMLDTQFANKELSKGHTVSLEKKLSAIDAKTVRMIEEIREVQSHANDTSKVFADYKQKIAELERKLLALQDALDTVLTALQIEEAKGAVSTNKVYVVQAGDSLEKIAKKQNASLKKLRELNRLDNDRIYPGQKLKLP